MALGSTPTRRSLPSPVKLTSDETKRQNAGHRGADPIRLGSSKIVDRCDALALQRVRKQALNTSCWRAPAAVTSRPFCRSDRQVPGLKIKVAAAKLDVGQGSPEAPVVFDNLPGKPHNPMRGLDGKVVADL